MMNGAESSAPPLTGRIEAAGSRWHVCASKNICILVYFRLETILGGAGRNEENCCLYAADRMNDMIVNGGSNGYEREVEEALAKLDVSAETAASSIPDR